MNIRNIAIIATMALPLLASVVPSTVTAKELNHQELIMLAPEPNIRPTLDANYNYVSGGVGILIYDGITAIDAIGPYQVFSAAGLKPFFVSASKDETGQYKTSITAESGIQLTAHRTIENTDNLEVLVVAGGTIATAHMAENTDVLNWVKHIDKTSVFTTSVCTGSWILGAAGLLQGKHATSHWYRADEILAHFGAIPESKERYIFDGKIITSAGVSAGIDMALAIVQTVFKNDLNNGRDYTQAIMLELQYDPKPPVNGGSPSNTDPYVYEGILEMYDDAGYWFYGLDMPFGDYVKTIPIQ